MGVGEAGPVFLEVEDNYNRVGRRWKSGKLLRAVCQGAAESPVGWG